MLLLTCAYLFVAQDDILPKLMTSTGSHEDLYRKEIAKYDHICQEIAQNVEGQEQLLMHIQVLRYFLKLLISRWGPWCLLTIMLVF